jgi:hypothetical protein
MTTVPVVLSTGVTSKTVPGSTPHETPAEVPSRPKPEATLEFRVLDIFGVPVKEAGLSFGVGGGIGMDKGDEGRNRWKLYDIKGGVHVTCGDYDVTHPLGPGANEILVPGPEGSRFGEIAVLPAGWDEVRIRLKGKKEWNSPTARDPELGQRFLFVLPGEHEVSDCAGQVAGSVLVTTGRRSSFALNRFAALKLEVEWLNSEPRPFPTWVPVNVRGITPGSSFPEGRKLLVKGAFSGMRLSEFGLLPGTYEVSSESKPPAFQETLQLKGGEIRLLKIQHWLK